MYTITYVHVYTTKKRFTIKVPLYKRQCNGCRGWTYLEMVIFVPDSAMIRFRVLPPFPARDHMTSHDNIIHTHSMDPIEPY